MRRKSITTKSIQAPHWENHESVVIRSLNTEDEEIINDGLANVDARGNTSIHAGRNKRLTLQRAIVSWTLTDSQGRPVPLNEDEIKALATEDSQFIFDEINALNKPMCDAQKKDLSGNATSGTETAG